MADRYGSLEDLARVVDQLRRIVSTLAPSNREASATARSRAADRPRPGVRPPAVTGVQLAATPRGVQLEWAPVNSPDLRYYQVNVSASSTFSNASTFTTSTRQFHYTVGSPNTTYYFRVRAVTLANLQGDWSATQSLGTGLVGTTDLSGQAANEYATFSKSSGFTELNTNGETETYGPVVILCPDDDTIVHPVYFFQISVGSDYAGGTNRITYELLRRPANSSTGDTVVDSAVLDIESDIPGDISASPTNRAVIDSPAFLTFDTPGAGEWEYRLRVTVTLSGGNVLTVTGVDLDLEFHAVKR